MRTRLSLQMINISWTNLSHIGQRTFKKIHPLRIVDLRWNKLIQLDTPLLLPRAFESLYLSGKYVHGERQWIIFKLPISCFKGNPWNCTRNLKWLLIPERASYVADRQILTCGDRKFKDRNVMTVMHYKVVRVL